MNIKSISLTNLHLKKNFCNKKNTVKILSRIPVNAKHILIFKILLFLYFFYATEHHNEKNSLIQDRDMPKFVEPMQNTTVSINREASFSCIIENLQTYKIAWLRVDTQTILTIQTHVIIKNPRLSVVHLENRAWVLKIKDVKESDKGWYMCQINTEPMKNQVGFLNVVVPPDILDYPTSTDMVVREGSNVTFFCAAKGSPSPTIMWRKESGEPIPTIGDKEVTSHNGSSFSIAKVNRLNMGAYLCIASNGIPPSVSKRIMLIVHFPPMIWIQNQLVGAAIGQRVTLECQSEAYPKSINYWMKNDIIIAQGSRFEPIIYENENAYKVVMKLTIKSVEKTDFGSYKCVAKNSLGDTDGAIKLYNIPRATTSTAALTTTTPIIETTTQINVHENLIETKKSSSRKTDGEDLMSISNNLVLKVTAGIWNTDNRERDHRIRSDTMSRTKDSENVASSSINIFRLSSVKKTLCLLIIWFL